MDGQYNTRLDQAMTALDLSSLELSRHCNVSNSLISRWRSGYRQLTPSSDAAVNVAAVLVSLDKDGHLDSLIESYRAEARTREEAVWLYLVENSLPEPVRGTPPVHIQRRGEYVNQQYVLLGRKGFQKGALLMLDYLESLPPGRHVTVCALQPLDWWHLDVTFALRFLRKLRRAINRGTSFTVVENHQEGSTDSPHFSVYWLVHNLKGVFRGRPFRGEDPAEIFLAAVPGYWSGKVERDDFAVDGIATTFATDPRQVRKDDELCRAYLEQTAPPSQYGFFQNPGGTLATPRRWDPDFSTAAGDDGPFLSISHTPLFGVMTQGEYDAVANPSPRPPAPRCLFRTDETIAAGRHRLILCREDMRQALTASSTPSAPLSALLRRPVSIPRETMQAMTRRILQAMSTHKQFEVALIPRRAFRLIELELITWPGLMSIGWLQDGSESMLDVDPVMNASYSSAVDYVWNTLLAQWKNPREVSSLLRGMLDGAPASRHDGEDAGSWEPYATL